MRVKTVPRQRIQNNPRVVSENFRGNFEQSKEDSRDGERKEQSLKHAVEALDMSDKCKGQAVHEHLNRRPMDAPACCKYERRSRDATRMFDDNNNILPTDTNLINCYSMAGPSSSKYSNEDTTKAVNLSKKDCHEHVEKDSSSSTSNSDDRFKDTFLYKIMTDPTFLETIRKNKQARRHACQFCKQDFPNGDDLANHMDVKLDESNQVVCCACKKTFAQKRYLRYHQRCHSERTKFTCDICTKKYTRLDNLTRHSAFHINPAKFSCMYCEKTFARKDLLNKHQKCHDNKNRFFCDMCPKYFKGSLTLDNHKKIFHSVA